MPTRWILIVIVGLLVILLIAYARGDEAERSVEALAIGLSAMSGARED